MTGWNRSRIIVTIGIGLGLLALVTIMTFKPRIIYNPSPSAPVGFYYIDYKSTPKVGDYIVLDVPKSVKKMALTRRYIGKDIPLLKQIQAQSGDHVCIRDDVIYVNYRAEAEVKDQDPSGREMPVWPGCRKLDKDEFFLLNFHSPYSFDSRYFGPILKMQIIGVATHFGIKGGARREEKEGHDKIKAT